MARRRKAAKLDVKKKEQRIEILPDGVIFAIISKLTLKESVRLSVLSKRLRFVWAWHPNLFFDSRSILGTDYFEYEVAENWGKFVERVDRFMHQRCTIGTKIDSLVVRYHLDNEYAPQLDNWIVSSLYKEVERIDIDLSEDLYVATSAGGVNYDFPSWVLAQSSKKCSLKHLSLTSCNLGNFPDCTSLISLQLRDVNISDHDLENLLSATSSSLERLSLELCGGLVNPVIDGANLCLKCLTVRDCFRLEKMEVSANSLVMFEYTGNFISFDFKRVPSLGSAFLNFTGDSKVDGGLYALTKFVGDAPQLEALNLVSILNLKALEFPKDVTAFTNVKHLVLTVFPFDDDDRLLWMTYVLKAFPLLRKLQLNLFCPSFIKLSSEVERVLPGCPHMHLRELEINGFNGNGHEVELLKYLVANLARLRELEISPCQKVFRGFNKWFYERMVAGWNKSRLESICEWFEEVVPCRVHFQVRKSF